MSPGLSALSVFQRRLFAVSTKGTQRYDQAADPDNDVFVFGPETRGLPADILLNFSELRRLRVPMVKGSRSLNLSNTVAIILYEAWRQVQFSNGL